MNLATLCYLREGNKTLFLYRNKKENDINAGTYIGIGGKVQTKETFDQCVRREFQEESGLTLLDPILKGDVLFKNEGAENWLVAMYVASKYTGTLHPSKEGELQWVDNDKIDQLKLSEGDRKFLPYVFKPEFFHGTFKYKVEDGRRTLLEYKIERV